MSEERRQQQLKGINVAMEMERRGRALYLRAIQFTDDMELKTLLHSLAEDEASHYALFSAMAEVYEVSSMSGEEAFLASAKAADVMLPGGLMQVAMDGGLESCEAMLDEAMQSEQDSIDFYNGLLLQAGTPEEREVLVRIIGEETNHLDTLKIRKEKRMSEESV